MTCQHPPSAAPPCPRRATRYVPALGRAVCGRHAGYWRRRRYEVETLTAAHLTDGRAGGTLVE